VGPHSEELYDLYCSTTAVQAIKSKRMRWVGYIACMGDRRDAYRILALKPEGERRLGKPRHRWEINIRVDLKE
jgi:hypothetical protein